MVVLSPGGDPPSPDDLVFLDGEEADDEFGFSVSGAAAFGARSFSGDGRPDLVVASYRHEFEYDTDSFVYWGTEDGFDTTCPLRLPSHCAR